MLRKIQQTTEFLKPKLHSVPEFGIVLGSGLGMLSDVLRDPVVIPYHTIPNFPLSTVAGHAGNLIAGWLDNRYVLFMQGRFHFYEGYSMKEVTFPIRIMKELGVSTLVLSNAAGGVNPDFHVGDIMLIRDHINLFPEHPLHGPNDSHFGTRFPDMTTAYTPHLLRLSKEIAFRNNIPLQEGVYVGTQGPSFETPAEYRFFHVIGGDAVGMSTVPEAIVASHAGLQLLAFSVITNIGYHHTDTDSHIVRNDHDEVQDAAAHAGPKLSTLIRLILQEI